MLALNSQTATWAKLRLNRSYSDWREFGDFQWRQQCVRVCVHCNEGTCQPELQLNLHQLDAIKRLLPRPSPLPPTRPPHGHRGLPFFVAAAATKLRSRLILGAGGSHFVLSGALKGCGSV